MIRWYAYHKWLIIFVVYDLRNYNSCSMAFPTSMNKNDNIHSFQKSTTNFRFGIFGYLRWILMNRVPEADMIRLRVQNQRIFLHLLLLDLGGTWTTLFQITNPRFGLISLALSLIWRKCKMSCSWSYISRMKWAITRYNLIYFTRLRYHQFIKTKSSQTSTFKLFKERKGFP